MVNRDRTCVWRETLPLLHVSRDITKHYKCVHTLEYTVHAIHNYVLRCHIILYTILMLLGIVIN